MKILRINSKNPEKEKIRMAINALKKGGVVVYPTDTVYGLGANIFHKEAIEKVYSIKKRPSAKPISVCVSKISDIDKIAYIDKKLEKIIEKILPGPFTIILRKRESISPTLTAGGEKIGIRIPDNIICNELSREFPITTTSANLAGEKPPRSAEEVFEQLGESADIILDGGICKHGIPSTVIDMTESPPKILRKGARIPLNGL
ncbi:MAG: threonylcarbamoyl-AMP synthase [Euryarchaeota archaeon]|nr:threonylcarbamoyl-AMP synthase [Euryarchaeota archaeon]